MPKRLLKLGARLGETLAKRLKRSKRKRRRSSKDNNLKSKSRPPQK